QIEIHGLCSELAQHASNLAAMVSPVVDDMQNDLPNRRLIRNACEGRIGKLALPLVLCKAVRKCDDLVLHRQPCVAQFEGATWSRIVCRRSGWQVQQPL